MESNGKTLQAEIMIFVVLIKAFNYFLDLHTEKGIF